MQALVDAERVATGLRPEAVYAPPPFRGDGGIDALVREDPPRPTDFVRCRTVFQAKRSLKISALRSQLKQQPEAKKLLVDGASYTLVVAQDVVQKDHEQLRQMLKEVVGRSVNSRLFGLSRLGDWLSQHPQLLSRVPGLNDTARHLRDFDGWTQAEPDALPWSPDPARVLGMERLSNLADNGVLRVTGAPGVGKTRLAMEALRPKAAAVTYVPRYVRELEDLVGSASPAYGVLVVDECSEAQHRRLTDLHRLQRGRLILITIGSEEDRRAISRDDELRLLPLAGEAMRTLALTASEFDPGSLHELTRWSGGYPKLFALLLEALRRSPERSSRAVPLKQKDIDEAVFALLGDDGDARAMAALAVLSLANPTTRSRDFEVLAQALDLTVAGLREASRCMEARALLGHLDEQTYVTPELLAERLALRVWDTVPERTLRAFVDADADEGFLERCLRRLERGSADSRRVLSQLLRDPALLLEQLGAAALARVVAHLAETDQVGALLFAEGLLTNEATWSADLGVALARCAWSETNFDRAALALALALSSRPSADRGVLTDLFSSQSGFTKADSTARVRVLRSLAVQPTPAARQLAAVCAAAACSDNISGAAGISLDGHWRPATRAEDRQYRLDACSILTALMADDASAVRDLAAQNAEGLIREQTLAGYPEVSVELVAGLASQGRDLGQARVEVAAIREFDLERMGLNGPDCLARLDAILTPRTLRDRLSALLARGIDFDLEASAADIADLGRELVESEDPATLQLLFQDGAGRFVIGEAVGRADSRRVLLDAVRDRAARPDASPLFSSGYLHGLCGEPSGLSMLDDWASVSHLARAVFDATLRLDASDAGARRLVRLITEGRIDAGRLGELSWAGWYGRATAHGRALLAPALEELPLIRLRLEHGRLRPSKRGGDWVARHSLRQAWIHVLRTTSPNPGEPWTDVTRTLLKTDLEFVRREALKRLETSGQFPPALRRFAPALRLTLPALGEVLEKLDDSRRSLAVHVLRASLISVERDEALTWVLEKPALRKRIAALLVGRLNTHPQNAAAALLDAFPGDPEVSGAVTHNFPEVWVGLEQGARDQLARVETFAKSHRRGVRMWANAELAHVKRQLERATEEDQAREHGIEPWEPREKLSRRLYKVAAPQEGNFSSAQAKAAGCSQQLLHRFEETGRIQRVRRGIYRLTEFPPGEHEQLVVAWLWSERRGVFSHATALALHRLSNVLPERIEMTLPLSWANRRISVPEGIQLFHAEVAQNESVSIGPIWATSISRTLRDCEAAALDVALLREATDEARRRGVAV